MNRESLGVKTKRVVLVTKPLVMNSAKVIILAEFNFTLSWTEF